MNFVTSQKDYIANRSDEICNGLFKMADIFESIVRSWFDRTNRPFRCQNYYINLMTSQQISIAIG